MKQNIIILAVLATLSMANAFPFHLHKRATTFAACPEGVTKAPALEVTILPDPPVAAGSETFTISGKSASELAPGSNMTFGIVEADAPLATVDFCTINGITCPVAAETAFSVIQAVTMPDTLPPTYTLAVVLTDATGTIVGCSAGPVGGAAGDGGADDGAGDDGAGGDGAGDDGAGGDGAGGDGAGGDGAGGDGAGGDGAGGDGAGGDGGAGGP